MASLTYLFLNITFMIVVFIAMRMKFRRPSRTIIVTLVVLLVLTAVFDNVLIQLSFVAYDTTKILGVYIGSAPIEDFMYAILAIMIVPAVWHKIGASHAQ